MGQPRLLGRPSRVRRRCRPADSPPPPTRLAALKAAAEELRLAQQPDGSIDTAAHDPTSPRPRRRDRRIRAGAEAPLPAPGRLHRRARRRPARLGRRRLRQARLRPLDRGLPARARPPRRDRAPLRVPDVQAERVPRHLLRGADRPRPVAEWIAELERALRQRQVPAGHLRRPHRRLRLRVRGPVPGDVLDRRAPPPSTTSARSSATARPSASRRVCGRGRDPGPQPAARRRVPALLARALRVGLHALGPDPRPHPHARRPARSTRS